VKAAAVLYIAIVGIVYGLVLRSLWHPQGWQLLADVIRHDVMPIVYPVYWLVFVPKGSLRWADAVRWLGFPAVYLVFSLVRGALTGFYPYPFLDVKVQGYPHLAFNAAVLLFVFLGLGLALVAVDRFAGRYRPSAHT
jgi:hypothetical protein